MGNTEHTSVSNQAWQVTDTETKTLKPKDGFIHDYLSYMEESNDAPLWYHLGAILTAMATASGRRDLRVIRSDGRQHYLPMHMWSAIVGNSGERKSAALDPAARLLHAVNPPSILATDGSPEAWHDRLAMPETLGVGVLHRDELAYLFDQARRAYSAGLTSWLLTCYQGGPVSRETKTGGFVDLPRVRLSILGAIPPDTLQQKTHRGDWRSGFLPRFTFWGGKRCRYMDLPGEDAEIEQELTRWMKAICWSHESPIIIPAAPAKLITDWTRDKIEGHRDDFPPDAFSAMTRLQEKGFRFAALFAVSDLAKIGDEAIQVNQVHAQMAVEMLETLKRTTLSMFNLVGADTQSTEEKMVLETIVASHKAITVDTIGAVCGMSRYKVQKILLTYMDDRVIFAQDIPQAGPGRPKKGYMLL